MFKINNYITIDLTKYVDVERLLKLKPYIEYAIVKHADHSIPAQYGGKLFLNQSTGFADISDQTKQDLLIKYPFLKEFDYKQMLMWLRYHLEIKYGQSHLHVIRSKTWKTKHLKKECSITPITDSFQPLLEWLDDQKIFLEYGRVNIFLNELLFF